MYRVSNYNGYLRNNVLNVSTYSGSNCYYIAHNIPRTKA